MTNTAWLLGKTGSDDFYYGAYRLVVTDDDRWCVRRAGVEVTICGRAILPEMDQPLEVYATCPNCCSYLAGQGLAVRVPRIVAVDAARFYWRYRDEATLANAKMLRQEVGA